MDKCFRVTEYTKSHYTWKKTGEKYSRDCDCGTVALKILGTGLRHAYQAMATGTFIFAWFSREHPKMNSNP